MSESPDQPPAPDATASSPPAPPRRHGLVRWWGFILVLALLLIALVAAPWWASSFVRTRIDQALLAQGWELDPASRLSVSVLGGRLASDGLRLRDVRKHDEVLRLSRLDIDLAVIDSLSAGDVIVESLVAEGVTGTLRRGPDGRIPWQRSEGSGDSQIDWAGYWRSAVERAKKWMEERQGAQERSGEEEPGGDSAATRAATKPTAPAPQADGAWPAAKRYQPTPVPGRRLPRLLVRHLSVSGEAIALPDPSAFDVRSFRLTGAGLADRLEAGERMTLEGSASTGGAGDAAFTLTRAGDGTGALHAAMPAVPVAALAEPNLGGEAVGRYGATGSAAIDAAFAWSGWELTRGDLVGTATDLHLSPTAKAGGQGKRAAQVVNALKGKPVTWPMTFAGPLWAPRLVDSGIDQVAKGAITEAAKEQAQEQLDKQLQKQADKDPRVKQGLDSVNKLFGR